MEFAKDNCINCGSDFVFAYVEKEHLPLCRECYVLYDKDEINAGQLREKRREKRAISKSISTSNSL